MERALGSPDEAPPHFTIHATFLGGRQRYAHIRIPSALDGLQDEPERTVALGLRICGALATAQSATSRGLRCARRVAATLSEIFRYILYTIFLLKVGRAIPLDLGMLFL